MAEIKGDLGKLLNGDFIPIRILSSSVDNPQGGTVEDHILNVEIHLTPEQAAQIVAAATDADLKAESQARADGDALASQGVDTEKTRAQAAEQSLQEGIDAEETRAKAAESTLQGSISAETTRAQGAESTLSASIADEASARQQADLAEETARQSADSDLQAQIDASKGQTRRFFIDFATEFGVDTPTKAQADAWLAARTPVALTPNVGTALKNSNTTQSTYNHLFVYYVDPSNVNGLILSDDGIDTVSTASATSLGVVRGAGNIDVDQNGDMYLKNSTVTDAVIGTRTLADNAGSAIIVPIAAKNLTAWLQGLRNNIKALLSYFTNGVANSAAKLGTARTIAISGKATGTATSFDGSGNITIPITALSQTSTDYPTLNQSTTGNAASATKLATKRNINVSGDITGTAQAFDGTADITIPVTLDASTATDTVIGNRTLADNALNATLVPVAAKSLTAWLQGIRNNLKALFTNKQDKAVLSATASALGIPANSTVDAALVSIANKRKNSFYISDFRTF